jgi:hypothetical protein
MSEQEKPKGSFMEELDRWSDVEIIDPLLYAGAKSAEEGADEADWQTTAEQSRKKLRAKMLESYRNGQAAGPRYFGRTPRRDYPPRRQAEPSRYPVRV